MILKQYGTPYQSVETNFNARALTEIAFRRDRVFSIPTEEFESTYEKIDEKALTAEAEGDVQDEAEEALLVALEASLKEVLSGLGEGEVLVVESRDDEGHPKTQDKKTNVVVDGENRLYFQWWVEPPSGLGSTERRGESGPVPRCRVDPGPPAVSGSHPSPIQAWPGGSP
jgi:hypothetical protein